MNQPLQSAAIKIWNYLNIRQEPVKTDIILVLGSDDIRIAHYACDLYLKGIAPYILFSGGQNKFTSKIYHELSEAESFAALARLKNISESAFGIETKSTNTQENLEFSFKKLTEENHLFNTVMLIQKPNMLRRVLATATHLFPSQKFTITTHPIEFSDSPHHHLPQEYLLHELAGDLQRLKLYAERGMITSQTIPGEVWLAYLYLLEQNYNGNLIR